MSFGHYRVSIPVCAGLTLTACGGRAGGEIIPAFNSYALAADLKRDGKADLILLQSGGTYIGLQDPLHPEQFLAAPRSRTSRAALECPDCFGHAMFKTRCKPWAAALAATAMVLLAPTVSASQLICEIPQDGNPLRYLVDIDDGRRTVTVVNEDTNKPYPITLGDLKPERVIFAFNALRLDPTKFVRQGKIVNLSITIRSDALIDRATNTIIQVGYLTDDEGKMLPLEQLSAMQVEEETRLQTQKGGPSHHPMFWGLLKAAIHRYEGLCRAAASHPDT